jgi:transposase
LDNNLRKLKLLSILKNTRRKHSAAFKTEVVLEAIKEQKTLSKLAQEYQLTPAQISTWKAEFLANG